MLFIFLLKRGGGGSFLKKGVPFFPFWCKVGSASVAWYWVIWLVSFFGLSASGFGWGYSVGGKGRLDKSGHYNLSMV